MWATFPSVSMSKQELLSLLPPALLLASHGTALPAFDKAFVMGNSTETNIAHCPNTTEGSQAQTLFGGTAEVAAAQAAEGCPPCRCRAHACEDAALVSTGPGLLWAASCQ